MWVTLILGLSALLLPWHNQRQNQRQRSQCEQNLRDIATALEMYASGEPCRYPPSLGALIPGHYLKSIPTCPVARRDTYSATYTRLVRPDSFPVECAAGHHGVRTLTYSAELGFFER